ncbi:hypothetical protein N8Z94_04750 [Planktomarina temperata]|nr:hypothetical protein [bacterium]MDC1271895.1 hypothetical protein [Planktomarina temperata]
MGLVLMDRLDSCRAPEFGGTLQGHGCCSGLAAYRAVISSKNHAAKAGIFTQDTVYSPTYDPADISADIQAKISTAERKERGIPKV